MWYNCFNNLLIKKLLKWFYMSHLFIKMSKLRFVSIIINVDNTNLIGILGEFIFECKKKLKEDWNVEDWDKLD